MADKRFRPQMEDEPPSFTENQENRIGVLGGPPRLTIKRFKYFVGAAILVLAVGNGFTVWAAQNQAQNARKQIAQEGQQNCLERNEQDHREFIQQKESRKLLLKLADIDGRIAARATDRAAGKIVGERAQLWRSLAENVPITEPPQPKCDFKP